MADKSPNILQKLGQRIGNVFKTILSTIDGLIGSGFNNFLLKVIPKPLHFLIPFLKDDVGIKAPSISSFKGIGLPEQKEAKALIEQIAVEPRTASLWQVKPLYTKYRCIEGNPFRCEVPRETVEEDPNNRYCLKCQFPAILPPEAKLRGRDGIYQIENYIGCRGQGRIYEATNLNDGLSVVLKEYVIPDRDFSPDETKLCKDSFEQLAGISLADGRVQDFRLITPSEAIADPKEERCYVISDHPAADAPTLASYLAGYGAMNNWQVRQFLSQTLQTLESLHGQKYTLRSGIVQQGLPHGNLSFYSLLIKPNLQGFYIYLTDLALWEHRFNSPLAQPAIYSVNRDLEDLGYIAFYLFRGGIVDLDNRIYLDPNVEEHWIPSVQPALKTFILNLIGIGPIKYESAEIARRALLKLPVERAIDLPPLEDVEPEVKPKKKRRWLRTAIVAGLVLLLLLLLGWWLSNLLKPRPSLSNEALPCCIEQVSGIPAGKFTYTAEKNATWSYVLLQDNLIAKGTTLETELQKRQPKMQLSFQPVLSAVDGIKKVKDQETEFLVTSLIGDLGTDLVYKEFAYDGLAVFVAFSYADRAKSLPTALKGQITFAQLKQIFTGQILNWKQLGGPDLPIKLYIPTDEESVRIFEQRILKDREAIESFRQMIKQNVPTRSLLDDTTTEGITPLQTFDTFRQVIRDFEDRNIGSIAFGSISRVFGQCSVYPLALADGNGSPVAPLIKTNGEPVTPTTDLCNDKGSYNPDAIAFVTQHYPLSYQLAVVYPRDNRRDPVGERFAAILKTDEAQKLLQKTGLIPLQGKSK
ncbi:substrate-binding domain-containing protein [Tumidithrix elongata RA019]|uniref:Substrate-binding domain-containing protein n=1 Tax=Tumidithrix elongata BACA0141 TaxID=2716417 RepID=A0AAW9Q4P7_9CYAN|nr:substrate-binding domain-containing protein [Tumidithrix elongata RA019]